MTEPRRVHSGRPELFLSRATPALLAVMLAAGCASSSKVANTEPEPNGALAKQSARQARSPDRKAMAAPPPPGVPPDLTADLAPDDLERANLGLDSVLARTPQREAPAKPTSPAEVSEDDRLEAMQAYVLGRARRLDGELQNALEDLRHAAKLDPGAASVWRELGEAEAAAGNRAGAASAFRRASELDPSDIRSLEMLSRGALDRRDFEEALGALSALRAIDTASYDPALPSILGVRLGRALLEEGYLRAGAEALRSSLALPERFSATTNYTIEMAQVYRQRGDLWRDLGDAALRRGNASDAAANYAEAAALPGTNPGSILPRRVCALMRTGRSAEAAALVAEEATSLRGRIDDRTQALIRYLASSSEAGPGLSAALSELQASLTPEDRAHAASSLTRARAAALSGPAAIRVLRDQLRERPTDAAVVRDLLSLAKQDPPGELLDEVIRLIEMAPILEPRYSGTLLNGPIEPSRLLDGWSSATPALSESGAGHVLHARLLAAIGDYNAAEIELAAIPEASPAAQAAIVARTEILQRLGRAEDAYAALAMLDERSSDDARAAKALALAQLGETEAALAMLEPLLGTPAAAAIRVDQLLLAARLNLALDRPAVARQLLEEAMTLDPMRDEPYAALIRLYSRGAPLASDAKLIETVRALMAGNPSSPTLRWLRAQESVGRGQLDLAERDLLDLAEEYPDRDSVVKSLVQVWRSTRSLEKAEQWLSAQALRRPWQSVYDLELAGVLTEQKRIDEAVNVLEHRHALARGDDEVSRRLEQILRDDAHRPERAAELTEARLARAPNSAEALVEFAELSLRQGDAQKAKERLQTLFAQSRPLGRDTLDRLAGLAVDAGRAVVAGRTPLPGPYVELILFITTQRPQVPLVGHLAAIQVLARTQGNVGTIIDVADGAAERYPQMSVAVYTTAFTELIGQGGGVQARRTARPGDAMKVIEHACTRLTPAPVPLLAMWLRMAGQLDGTDPQTLMKILEITRDSDSIDALLMELQKNLQPENREALAADTAHRMALGAQSFNREDLATWLYRVSIRHNPDHVMSNNNLGYSLLQRDESVEEAAGLIERAYAGMLRDPKPDEKASITDSMGWARYRMGVIVDEPGREGAPAREGAVTLLTRALELSDAEFGAAAKQIDAAGGGRPPELFDSRSIIGDHLGDALWRADQKERAIEVWTSASERAEATVKAVGDSDGIMNQATLREYMGVAQGAKSKAEAARAGQAPQLARTVRPANASTVNEPTATSDIIQ